MDFFKKIINFRLITQALLTIILKKHSAQQGNKHINGTTSGHLQRFVIKNASMYKILSQLRNAIQGSIGSTTSIIIRIIWKYRKIDVNS